MPPRKVGKFDPIFHRFSPLNRFELTTKNAKSTKCREVVDILRENVGCRIHKMKTLQMVRQNDRDNSSRTFVRDEPLRIRKTVESSLFAFLDGSPCSTHYSRFMPLACSVLQTWFRRCYWCLPGQYTLTIQLTRVHLIGSCHIKHIHFGTTKGYVCNP